MATLSRRTRWGTIRQAEWIEQGAKFLLVGMMNTVIDLGLYFSLTRFVVVLAEANFLAKGISYSVGMVNSYLWNRSWTFQSDDRSWKTFLPFVLAKLVGMALNTSVLWVGLQLLVLPEIMALLLATGMSFLWNFTVSKFLIFRR